MGERNEMEMDNASCCCLLLPAAACQPPAAPALSGDIRLVSQAQMNCNANTVAPCLHTCMAWLG